MRGCALLKNLVDWTSSFLSNMPKKPRHRHSPAQLAALNGLYEETEHPTLSQRIALAQSVGLETKSVNSYFQNKRASAKKRPRGVPYISSSSVLPSLHPDIDHGDTYSPTENTTNPSFQPDFPYPPDFLSESESMLGRSRLRSSSAQIDELQKGYGPNPPPLDETQAMADSIGMYVHLECISEVERQKEIDAGAAPEDGDLSRPFPPGPDQPSLTERGRRSPTSSVVDDGLVSRSRRTSSRRSATPYNSTSAISLSARQRRARPEPLQLDALKQLYGKTPTPSIEERSALALEIGMEIGKVTNWFRNLRQSARKREKKGGRQHGAGSDDDPDYTDGTGFYSPSASASASRSGTPSSLSLEREDGRRRHLRPIAHSHSSDEDEDEEYPQEAVTPSPSQSPSPASSPSHARVLNFGVAAALQDAMVQMAKEDKFKDLAADALLLLEFQATCQ
ncbi:hypothetical protein B0H19DRAFT_1127326 [Mycena capillaripes]|nr:hypothetical protein B0H19DRAFT_1127326 [Mycena capillaripes]